MADTYRLKVNTEQIKEVAESTRGSIDRLKDIFSQIETTATSVGSYWEGAGESSHLKCFQNNVKNVDPILNSFYSLVNNLLQVAGIYEQTENQNINVVDSLPTDVIS